SQLLGVPELPLPLSAAVVALQYAAGLFHLAYQGDQPGWNRKFCAAEPVFLQPGHGTPAERTVHRRDVQRAVQSGTARYSFRSGNDFLFLGPVCDFLYAKFLALQSVPLAAAN